MLMKAKAYTALKVTLQYSLEYWVRKDRSTACFISKAYWEKCVSDLLLGNAKGFAYTATPTFRRHLALYSNFP